MKRTIFVLVTFVIMSGYGAAQDGENPTLHSQSHLSDYLRYLDAHSPVLKQESHRIEAAIAAEEIAGTLPDPNLNLSVFAQEVETRVGPQKQKLGVSQSLPWKGKRSLQTQLAQEETYRVQENREARRQELHFKFKNYYADYFFIGKALVINQEHLVLLENLEKVVDTKYRAGETGYTNLVRIDVEMDRFRDRIASLKDLALPTRAAMNAMLGRAIEAPINFPKMLHDARESAWLLEAEPIISQSLMKTNPQMRASQHLVTSRETARSLAQLKRRPDFKVGVDWINTGSAVMAGVPESGKDPLVFSVGVNIPWNKRKYNAMERVAGEHYLASVEEQNNLEYQLTAQLKRAFYDYRDALRKIELYRDTVMPKARESMSVTLMSFEHDVSGYLDVIDAEQTLLEFALSMNQAMADRTRALARIELISGVPLPLNSPAHGH